MKQKSIQSFVQVYANLFGLRHLTVEQQYSMRSYETGLYDIRTDGNLRSMINILNELGPHVFRSIFISAPLSVQLKNGHDDIEWLRDEINHSNVDVVQVEYAEHALANRQKGVLKGFFGCQAGDMTITYFDISERPHAVFICPGSPRPENPLYSMDEFPWFAKQVQESTATFFFNKNQDIYNNDPSKIFEISNFVHVIVPETYVPVEEMKDIDIYFPYRLTDKDYNFEKLMLEETLNSVVGVTDPNNSLETLPYYDKIKHRVVKLDPRRHMDNLLTIRDNINTLVYMPSDLRKTVHMGPVETYMIFMERDNKFMYPFSIPPKDQDEIKEEAIRCMVGVY